LGHYEICPICYWEDDVVQFQYPNFEGGANEECLTQAKQNYKQFGAASRKHIDDVRKPFYEELPKNNY
jgi:hypothetical protein